MSSSKILTNPTEIKTWLESVKIKRYSISPTGVVDVYQNVELASKKLNFLPVKFGVVEDSFNCSDNQLTSFEGFPSYIKGYLMANHNQLTSLVGMPLVDDDINVAFNQLTSLKGIQSSINGTLSCQGNKLSTLKDGPEKIKSDLLVSKNVLTSLEGVAQKIGGSIYAQENELISLKGIGQKVDKLDVSHNKLESLEYLPSIFSLIDASFNSLSKLIIHDNLLDMNQFSHVKSGEELCLPNQYVDFFVDEVYSGNEKIKLAMNAHYFNITFPRKVDLTHFTHRLNILNEKNNLETLINNTPQNTKNKLKI
jgi:hypothetical protein